jgi:hypothetical protein
MILVVSLMLGIASSFAQEPVLPLPPPPGASSQPASILCFLLIGVILGIGGQIARSAVGIKKKMDAANETEDNSRWVWFSMQKLLVSLLLGAASGAFACIIMWGEVIDKKFLIACIAAGYAGADFIEGFVQTYLSSAGGNKGNQNGKDGQNGKGDQSGKEGQNKDKPKAPASSAAEENQ